MQRYLQGNRRCSHRRARRRRKHLWQGGISCSRSLQTCPRGRRLRSRSPRYRKGPLRGDRPFRPLRLGMRPVRHTYSADTRRCQVHNLRAGWFPRVQANRRRLWCRSWRSSTPSRSRYNPFHNTRRQHKNRSRIRSLENTARRSPAALPPILQCLQSLHFPRLRFRPRQLSRLSRPFLQFLQFLRLLPCPLNPRFQSSPRFRLCHPSPIVLRFLRFHSSPMYPTSQTSQHFQHFLLFLLARQIQGRFRRCYLHNPRATARRRARRPSTTKRGNKRTVTSKSDVCLTKGTSKKRANWASVLAASRWLCRSARVRSRDRSRTGRFPNPSGDASLLCQSDCTYAAPEQPLGQT